MAENPDDRDALAREVAARIARELSEDLARMRARLPTGGVRAVTVSPAVLPPRDGAASSPGGRDGDEPGDEAPDRSAAA